MLVISTFWNEALLALENKFVTVIRLYHSVLSRGELTTTYE